MYGRHGIDQMGQDMSRLTMVLLVLNILLTLIFGGSRFTTILYYVALALLIWSYYRMFSKKLDKRYQENQKYLQWKYKHFGTTKGGWKRKWQNTVTHFKQRKTHVFFKCPSCGQKLRTPKGQGLKYVTCPKCHTQFSQKT
jgi:predicted RNA-binding Zn-ribbon protein involved in translation (DUF1610 family)